MFSLALFIPSPPLPPSPSCLFFSNCCVAVYKALATQPKRKWMAVIFSYSSYVVTV